VKHVSNKDFETNRLLYSFYCKDVKPISLNNLYPTSKSGHRYMSDDGLMFKTTLSWHIVKDLLDKKLRAEDFSKLSNPLILKILLGFPDMFYKNGNLRKRDTSNHIKPIEDVLAEVFGYNDTLHFESSARKVCSDFYFISLDLYEFNWGTK